MFTVHSRDYLDADFPVLEQAARGIVPCFSGDQTDTEFGRIRRFWSWVARHRAALKRINRAAQEEYEIGGEV